MLFHTKNILRRRIGVWIGLLAMLASQSAWSTEAARFLKEAGLQRGVCVQIGGGDGRATIELSQSGKNIVHRLEHDPKQLQSVRDMVRKQGLYGRIAVVHWTGKKLPYADNLINFILADTANGIPDSEIIRALCPNGTAFIKVNGKYRKIVKPRPSAMDEWQQFRHDSGRSRMSQDTIVGCPS